MVTELGCIRNKFHLIIESGDSLKGTAWYQEIDTQRFHTNRFYLFTAEITNDLKAYGTPK